MQFTTQTKIEESAAAFLEESACYVGKLRAKLLKEMLQKKCALTTLKKRYIAEYKLTARQFNSLASEVQGLIRSATTLWTRNIEERKARIAAIVKKIKTLQKKLKETCPACGVNGKKSPRQAIKYVIQQKKRKLACLQAKLETAKEKGVRICLGTRKLFLAQYHLEENGYQSHAEWLQEWRRGRSNRIFYLGSKDESLGNQNCQLLGNNLQVRVLPALEHKFGKIYRLTDIEFPYGSEVIKKAIASKQAINFRCVRKQKGWYLYLTTQRPAAAITSRKALGVIGVDLNPSHLAWAETDRYGNLSTFGNIPTPLRDRSSSQAKATLAEAAKEIVLYAKAKEKPIAIEELDFSKKKTCLEDKGISYRRMLTCFAYSLFHQLIISRAHKEGVAVLTQNPAFSSIIGKYKFMLMFGIAIHIAAAFVLARRGMGLSERLPASYALGLAEHKPRHVWSLWRVLSKAVSNRELWAERKLSRLPGLSPPR